MIGPFTGLLGSTLPGDHPVALSRSGRSISWSRFRSDVEALSASLAAMPELRWALCFSDSYWFAVSLFAAGLAGKEIIIPGNITSKNALLAIEEHYDAVLGDLGLRVNRRQLRPSPGPGLTHLPARILPETKVTLFTSGSTSEALAICKSFKDLENEVTVLLELFGPCYSHREVFATVSHQHIYGLLFRLLLPLAAHAPFSSRQLEYPDQVARSSAKNRVLVSSPALLKRLAGEIVANGYGKVFSSGGPLPGVAARQCRELFGSWPIEVYGSSETGGIGWREQESEEQPWQAFPGIDLRCAEEDRLAIRSPFIAADDWYVTHDRVSLLTDRTFRLLGRVDRIVKISEKRISLVDVEQHLQQLAEIIEAVVVPLQRAERLELGAVVRLSGEGLSLLTQHGKHAFTRRIRRSLAAYIEPVGVPRKFRFVDEIPVNSQGKHVLSVLGELFER